MVILSILIPLAAADSSEGHMNLSLEDMDEEHLIYDNASVYDAESVIGAAPISLAHEFPKTSYAEWSQGECGNCWVWAGTGSLAQSLYKFSGTSTPLSIQFFNSNYMDGNIIMTKPHNWACTGGFASTFADIYTTGVNQSYLGGPFVVPWNNYNASYKDSDVPTSEYAQTTLPKNLMTNTPNTGFSRVQAQRVLATPPSNQTAAVENITLALTDGKVLYYAMQLPNKTVWAQFQDFWDNKPNDLWNMDLYNQTYYNSSSGEGNGHAMILMGYNKTGDNANHYWIIQNSWGNTTNRTNGQYKLKMWMDYNATFNNTEWTSQDFWVFNVSWKTDPTVTAITPSTGHNTGSVSITNLAGTNFVNGAEVKLKSSSLNPRHFGSIVNGTDGALIANPYKVAIANNYAYIASYNSSALEIVNLTNPSDPVHEGRIVNGDGGASLQGAIGVAVSGDYAYVASYLDNTLEIVNISIPSAPVHKGKISHLDGGPLLKNPQSVDVVGNYAYVASYGSNALEIIDISNPAAPSHKGSIVHNPGGALLTGPVSVDVVENYPYAYVASSGSNALEIVDISDPANPVHMANITDGTGGSLLKAPRSVSVIGYYAYVTSYTSNALEIIQISNKSAPVHKGSIAKTAGVSYLNGPVDAAISADATYAYVSSFSGSTLDIVDISDPSAPVYKTGISDGTGGALLKWPSSVAFSRSLAFVTSRGNDALEVVALDAIPATGVTVVSSNKITGTFDLTGAATGTWDVVVTNINGRFKVLTSGFTTIVSPPVDFKANKTSFTAPPAAVQFNDTSGNNPTSWYWDFGDLIAGNTSTLQNPVHTYTSKGAFNVTLIASNAYGSNTTTKTSYISIGRTPIPFFSYTPTQVEKNTTVSFDASGSTDPDGTITNYQWNFGDNNITSLGTTSITHLFNQSQVYNVTLTITDNDAFTNSTMQQLQVIAKIEDANTNINGSTITTSATGKQMIEVNQTNTNGTVTLPSANTVVINNPGNGWSRMKYVSNTNFVNESNGNINLSSISQVVMTTEPLITALNASTVGTVTSTVTLPLNQLPTGVTLTQSITEGANVSVRNAFQLSATDNNLNFGAVAYTVQFQNTALINANLTGAADPVQLNMSVLHSWVVANGPTTDKIKIMRIADDGQRSMLTTRYLGSSADTLTDFFECDSPNGLSTFGVVSVSSTGGGGDSGSGGGIGGDSGSVAPALASPSTIAVNVGGNSAINKVTVTGTGVNNIIVTALPHAVLPGSIPPMATTVYQYIAVTPARYTTISSVTLNFNVPASWLADKGFTKNDIALMLWDPTAKTWSSLPTSIISESQGTITYQAIAPHMSEFAVAYQKGAAFQANVTVIQTEIPLSAPTTITTPNISIRLTSPTQTQTIAPAASTPPSLVTPLTTMVIAVVGIIIIVGGAFLVRRWWIRRQNPALFRRYD